MPRINIRGSTGSKKAPAIGELRQHVVVCTTTEKPDENVSTIVDRPGVFHVHGRVRPIKGEEVLHWKGVFETANVPTVEVTIRVPPDVHVDIGHWCFVSEQYRESWLRVRSVEDMGGARRWLILLCSIETVRDRRSDPVTQPPPPVFERPLEAPAPLDEGF